MGQGLSRGGFDLQDFFDAIMMGNLHDIRRGLKKGWADKANGRGELPAFIAIRSNRVESLRELLPTVDVLKPNGDGATPLSAAAASRNPNMLAALAPQASMAEVFGLGQLALATSLKFGWVDSALVLTKRLVEDLNGGKAHGSFLREAMTDFASTASRNRPGNEEVERKVIETVSILMRATSFGDDEAYAREAASAAAKSSALGEEVLGPMVAGYALSLREEEAIGASLALPPESGARASTVKARL